MHRICGTRHYRRAKNLTIPQFITNQTARGCSCRRIPLSFSHPWPVISNECEKSLFASLRLFHFYFLISSFCFLVSFFLVLRHPIQEPACPPFRGWNGAPTCTSLLCGTTFARWAENSRLLWCFRME